MRIKMIQIKQLQDSWNANNFLGCDFKINVSYLSLRLHTTGGYTYHGVVHSFNFLREFNLLPAAVYKYSTIKWLINYVLYILYISS